MRLKAFFASLSLILLACGGNEKTNRPEDHAARVKHPEWSKTAVIYEANIRQHTLEGTFNAFAKEIPRLKAMGIDIVWLMPIHPIGAKNRKGSLGSYYSIKDYTAINPEFGTEEEFRHLVNTIHAHDMKVIIDWVANHTAWDHSWTETHPEYYNRTESGEFQPPVADWEDVIDLDYNNEELRKEMLNAMKYWVSEFDIDGYRCDVAGMVPIDFWNTVRAELDAIKPVFMLAEGEEPELHEEAFDMTYSWELMHLMRRVASGEESPEAIKAMYKKDFERYPKGYYKMNIITNHDENSWNGTAEEFFGEGQEAWFVFAATTYGMPLVYSGQEANNKKRLEFFEKDSIDWSRGYVFSNLYKTLFQLKEDNPALWNGEFGGSLEWIETSANESVLAYKRKKGEHEVVVFINIQGQPITLTFEEELGAMRNVMDNIETVVSGELSLPPNGFKVFAK
ncbi:alpha-amylase family glycosyl hydrolase [Roseivirga thermotolerans]|uniref:alpha-amylase family glycosyl hydrolase n=1 Tax=Roseivirga thermotolerans TaxID=1758176 RepID=UPI00273EBF50|nr:alpha-amylase family glycosyl hydrolase [Roseivirga thermotolerans]